MTLESTEHARPVGRGSIGWSGDTTWRWKYPVALVAFVVMLFKFEMSTQRLARLIVQEKEVHLILRPVLSSMPDSVLISRTCNQKEVANASCGSCSSRVGYKLPFGPGGRHFVAFGSDTVMLF